MHFHFIPKVHVIDVLLSKDVMLFCVNTCVVRMYYVMHKQGSLAQAIIHLGTHEHLVAKGRCGKVVKQIKALVQEKVFCTPLTIMLVANKTILSQHLFNKDGEGLAKLLKGDKLNQVMDKFATLCSPNVKNLLTSFKFVQVTKGLYLTL